MMIAAAVFGLLFVLFLPMAYLGWRLDRAPVDCVEDVVVRGRPDGRLLLCLGDSITHGHIGADWVGAVREANPGLTVVNGGCNGEMAWNVRQRLDEAMSLKPDAVTLLIGTNDVMAAHRTDRAEAYVRQNKLPRTPDLQWSTEQLTGLIAELASRRVPLAVLTIPPLGDDPTEDVTPIVASWNDRIRALVGATPATLLDLHAALTPLTPPSGGRQYRGGGFEIVTWIGAALARHYLMGRTWDQIATHAGWSVTVDGIHLSDRGGQAALALIQPWLDDATAQ